jgi:hypothetical protein
MNPLSPLPPDIIDTSLRLVEALAPAMKFHAARIPAFDNAIWLVGRHLEAAVKAVKEEDAKETR